MDEMREEKERDGEYNGRIIHVETDGVKCTQNRGSPSAATIRVMDAAAEGSQMRDNA